jgi:glycerol-3-phosphate dehydrogenase|tara:strand:+ start:305 stop:508 length:204 start_codon:yes stop_codon:yes gene_type:complete
MCIICVGLEKEALTTREAWRNLNEMKYSMEEEHTKEVMDKLWGRLHSRMFDDDKELDLWAEMLDFTF